MSDRIYKTGQEIGQNGGNIPQIQQTKLNQTEYEKLMQGYKDGQKPNK